MGIVKDLKGGMIKRKPLKDWNEKI
jgi:hypothetical protein